MDSSNYSYSMIIIIYSYTVVWFQAFLSNTNNLQAIKWFELTNDNNPH